MARSQGSERVDRSLPLGWRRRGRKWERAREGQLLILAAAATLWPSPDGAIPPRAPRRQYLLWPVHSSMRRSARSFWGLLCASGKCFGCQKSRQQAPGIERQPRLYGYPSEALNELLDLVQPELPARYLNKRASLL